MTGPLALPLAELARELAGAERFGDGQVVVAGISHDSRRTRPGDLFVAVPGTKQDGASFIPAALEAGAVAVLGARRPDRTDVPALVVPDVRLAMGIAAARLHRRPDLQLELVGVTGTNGKTTITYILEAILERAGLRPGVIGTVNYRFGAMKKPAANTTPESTDLIETIAAMREMGATHAIMEVSSHALDQKRVAGLAIRHGAFTNLTRDHLDYHPDLEAYYQAKKKLFTEVLPGAWTAPAAPPAKRPTAAINLDDPAGRRLAAELAGTGLELATYSRLDRAATVRAHEARFNASGLSAVLAAPAGEIKIVSPLVGAHNLENLLAAAALALALGVGLETIAAALATLRSAPGRLEPVPNRRGLTILVDYAHTPDALERAIKACAELKTGRLIVVFGCGGDRDPGKRPLMGKIAVAGAELAVVTSDNPRTEDPIAIIDQVLAGIAATGAKRLDAEPDAGRDGRGFMVEPDRSRAIGLALGSARPGDIVLIAGKGHEDYQILGTRKIHFDDREEAMKALGE